MANVSRVSFHGVFSGILWVAFGGAYVGGVFVMNVFCCLVGLLSGFFVLVLDIWSLLGFLGVVFFFSLCFLFVSFISCFLCLPYFS